MSAIWVHDIDLPIYADADEMGDESAFLGRNPQQLITAHRVLLIASAENIEVRTSESKRRQGWLGLWIRKRHWGIGRTVVRCAAIGRVLAGCLDAMLFQIALCIPLINLNLRELTNRAHLNGRGTR